MELPVERLVAYGLPPALVETLSASGVTTLRGPQARAVLSGDLFSSEHLLVHLPTSSGKTLLGELAALSAILAGKKALFAVPLKALAEEKYAEWRRRYADYGLSVVCSTADHDQDDARLCRGEFDLGVVIYESCVISGARPGFFGRSEWWFGTRCRCSSTRVAAPCSSSSWRICGRAT
ncbi:DEAD/DEAH box helicase [bacterium]|nr:DEAD/DEAH box helicase [bacterium]